MNSSPIEMIDPVIAVIALSQIEIGDIINVIIREGEWENRKVKSKTAYSVIVEPVTASLMQQATVIPINKTETYMKEKTMRSPIPGQASAKRGPGRPPKNATQAPVEHPAPQRQGTPEGGWLPPGSPLGAATSSLAPDVAIAEKSFTQPVQTVQPNGNATEEVQGNWVETAVDEAIDNFRAELNMILAGIDTENEQAKPDAATKFPPLTCADCNNVDLTDGGKCTKFNMVPPMSVITNAKVMCPDFTDLIPF